MTQTPPLAQLLLATQSFPISCEVGPARVTAALSALPVAVGFLHKNIEFSVFPVAVGFPFAITSLSVFPHAAAHPLGPLNEWQDSY